MATAVPKNEETLPLTVVEHVLWHFGDFRLGVQPGTFTERLLLTFSAADATNFRTLWDAFPGYGLAFHLCSRMPNGLEQLRDRVKAER